MKQSMRDEPVKDCPECDKGKVHRIIKKVSFQLKGTGFYSTRGDT
jgi:putative FmdB family regulatory protein